MPIGQLSKHVFELISSDDPTRKLPKIIVAISVGSTPVLGRTCENDEFQCIHPDDGCIPYEDSCNGWIDCMRDGSDESEGECGTNKKWARRIPEGLI